MKKKYGELVLTHVEKGHREKLWLCIAKKHKPPGYTVKYRDNDLTGEVDVKNKIIYSPKPTTRRRLYIYLHECSHVLLNHENKKFPVHKKEYEAEVCTQYIMRSEGIKIPKCCLDNAKKYVEKKIKEAINKGCKNVDPQAIAFVGWIKLKE